MFAGMTTLSKSAAGLLILMPAFLCLAGCAQSGPRYLTSSATARPSYRVVAQEPNSPGGSERIPDYPAGAEPAIVTGGPAILIPNGGETIVQSANSLPD
jgi:predicted small lipoprotein YifL